LLHWNWDLYDTAHVVFRPKQMSPDELLLGYAGYTGVCSRIYRYGAGVRGSGRLCRLTWRGVISINARTGSGAF
jgi:hypothetical protein